MGVAPDCNSDVGPLLCERLSAIILIGYEAEFHSEAG
jgi:hypothetical protein